MHRPSVIQYPESAFHLMQGFNALADLLSSTLGPSRGVILSSTDINPKPELITDSATASRRMTELEDARQNVGAMLLRNMVWRVHERVGDGGALTAVLAQSILEHALKCISAGADPISVLNGVKLGAKAAVDQLGILSCPIRNEEDLTSVAYSVTGEWELSRILGEMFDILGTTGYITVEEFVAPFLEREYLQGGRWSGSLASPYLINSPGSGRAILQDLKVVLFDGVISSTDEARAILDLISTYQPPHLLLVAEKISDEALGLLVGTSKKTEIKIIAVSLKQAGEDGHNELLDLATLCGAQLISPRLGRILTNIHPEDVGKAKRAEANSDYLLLVGGEGDPAQVRNQIETIQNRLDGLPFGDIGRDRLQMRIARFAGSAGILKVGAYTQTERAYLHQLAEKATKVLRAALEEGVLPGGGTAYLACISIVERLLPGLSPDMAMGVRAMARALEAPIRVILKNAGVQSTGAVIEHLRKAPEGDIYDVITGQISNSQAARVQDSAKVLRTALETAASGAGMAISTGVIVLKKQPRLSYEP